VKGIKEREKEGNERIQRTELVGDCNGILPVDHDLDERKERTGEGERGSEKERRGS